MKSMKFLLPALCLGAVSVCQAADKPNVTALPISNRVIQGEMTLANGELLKFSALEGTLVTVQGPDVGSFAISGEILNEENAQVRFTIFEILDFGGGNHGLKQVEQLVVADHSPAAALEAQLPAVTVHQIRTSERISQDDIRAYRAATMSFLTGASVEGASPPAPPGDEVQGNCCVTCGSTTSCGCAVVMSCGSCCSGVCCPGGSGKDPQNNS